MYVSVSKEVNGIYGHKHCLVLHTIIQVSEKLNLDEVKVLCTDSGKEFDNASVQKYTQEIGLKNSMKASSYILQQSGVTQRENRIISEMARFWLHSAFHLSKLLRDEV